MKLLVDTDAFCKLSASGIFIKALNFLGADLSECARLPALPYMLRRGRLRDTFGSALCDELLPIVQNMPIVGSSRNALLDKLATVSSIDPGEAQLFSVAAESGMLVITGDKRVLRALKGVEDFAQQLSGRIIAIEALLVRYATDMGPIRCASAHESWQHRTWSSEFAFLLQTPTL